MLRPSNASVPCDQSGVARAVAALRAGGLVGLPTETVYGLAADARNNAAVKRVFTAKGRPADHPLIVHIADISDLHEWAKDIPAYAHALAERLWPGPLTLVLPARDDTSRLLTGGQDTIALRLPAHPAAQEVIRQTGALAAPSANRFGRVSPTSAQAVVAELAEVLDDADVVLDGGDCSIGIESTIVDCTSARPRILRPGFYAEELINDVAGIAGVPVSAPSDLPRVSGSLPGHYAPSTQVTVVQPDDFAGMDGARLEHALVLTTEDVAVPSPAAHVMKAQDALDFARILYAALRRADELGVQEVLVTTPPAVGIGVAIIDRITRAVHGSAHMNP